MGIFLKSILLRTGIRSDWIWCNPILFHEPFRRIPFYLDTYALMQSQYWSREDLEQLSLERFAQTVRRASSIPFWKERLEKAGIDPNNFRKEDIARIPVLSKKDFFEREVEAYTLSTLLPTSKKNHTSGSTGKPLNFYHDRGFELRSSAVSERMFKVIRSGTQAPVVLMKVRHDFGFDYTKYHFFFLRGYTMVQYRIDELQKFLRVLSQKAILFGLGSSLVELARVCRERGVILPVECVLATGESLTDLQRKEIEQTMHTRVRITYGMNEIRRLGFECEHRRIHLNEESVYFEVCDDDGNPLQPGDKGRIIVTGFENRVMPFIRYDTGDIGVIHSQPCPCGRTLRTIEFQGRKVKLLHVGDGRTVSLMDFFFVFDVYARQVRQFQFVRTGERAFTVRIVPGDQFSAEEVQSDVNERLKTYIHPTVEITWDIVDSIPEGPNGKAQYFIDTFEERSI